MSAHSARRSSRRGRRRSPRVSPQRSAGRARRVRVASATAAALALAPAALIFVADPWIDWRGGRPESPERAELVLRVNPVAALTSPQGGLGADFQRMPWMYDGPAEGVPGLSLVGQYYPAVPPSPWAWGGVALTAGLAAAFAARRRDAA